jgi:hypothetical protein
MFICYLNLIKPVDRVLFDVSESVHVEADGPDAVDGRVQDLRQRDRVDLSKDQVPECQQR